jgi:hypothetical protein
MRFQCDMTTMNKLIEWRPKFSIEDGVRRTWTTIKAWKKERDK